jgi:hypothetical protein
VKNPRPPPEVEEKTNQGVIQVSLYQSFKLHYKKPEFWLMVGFIAVNIILSFGQTKVVAELAGAENRFHQIAFSIILEGLFAFTLLTRADQRAQNLNVPKFLNVAYFGLLLAITLSNITVLYQYHEIAGPFLGVLITGTMLYTEKLFVWKNTEANKPARKKPRDLMREAKKEIQEERILQKIEWLKWEAKKPDLKLIKQARKAEEKRKTVEGDRLPQFFLEREKEDPIKQIQAELVQSEPKIVDVDADVQTLPARRIGFHAEDERRVQSSVQTNVQPVQNDVQKKSKADLAYEYALILYNETEEVPKCRDIVQYSKQFGDKKLSVSLGTAKAGLDQLKKEIEQNQN